jgi:hypothetical protein
MTVAKIIFSSVDERKMINRKYIERIGDKILSFHRTSKVGNKINKARISFIPPKKNLSRWWCYKNIYRELCQRTRRVCDDGKYFPSFLASTPKSSSFWKKQEGKSLSMENSQSAGNKSLLSKCLKEKSFLATKLSVYLHEQLRMESFSGLRLISSLGVEVCQRRKKNIFICKDLKHFPVSFHGFSLSKRLQHSSSSCSSSADSKSREC